MSENPACKGVREKSFTNLTKCWSWEYRDLHKLINLGDKLPPNISQLRFSPTILFAVTYIIKLLKFPVWSPAMFTPPNAKVMVQDGMSRVWESWADWCLSHVRFFPIDANAVSLRSFVSCTLLTLWQRDLYAQSFRNKELSQFLGQTHLVCALCWQGQLH